jgi:ABC-type branched-subunit amino acid transport system ATPase component
MVAITSIDIENFRCFQKLRVDGLAPVNLIVGANNAGKTVLLEAIEAVVSRDSPFVLYRASLERNEYRRRRAADEDFVELDLRHWFHGHALAPGVTFRIHATGDEEFAVSRSVQAVPPGSPSPPFVPNGLCLTMERPGARSMSALPLTADHLLGAGTPSEFQNFGLRLNPAVGFVTTNRLLPRQLARLWTRVVLTPGEQRTIDALRLIESQIERIAISESDDTIAKVLLSGAEGPVPLGTLGEGVSRILTLALHLALTQHGFLLIDEIENGLHWSVMPKVWRFLVETALAGQIQVFAATHSKDWLEGLADLHRTDPALAAHVAVHRLEAGRETSIRFDAGRIAEYVEMELEAR